MRNGQGTFVECDTGVMRERYGFFPGMTVTEKYVTVLNGNVGEHASHSNSENAHQI